MDIHAPKPVHNVREFLSEILVIIIGVLLALAAEQAAEWYNWQSEVKESREAIAREIAHNFGTRRRRHSQTACIDRRLDELQRWHDSWEAGSPIQQAAPIGSMDNRILEFDAWEVALSGQVAAHIDLEDRIRYAALYSRFRAFQEVQQRENGYWEQLQKFDRASRMGAGELMELQGLINKLRTINTGRRKNWPDYARYSRQFGIPIGSDDWRPETDEMCRPMLADDGAGK